MCRHSAVLKTSFLGETKYHSKAIVPLGVRTRPNGRDERVEDCSTTGYHLEMLRQLKNAISYCEFAHSAIVLLWMIKEQFIISSQGTIGLEYDMHTRNTSQCVIIPQ